MPLLPLEPYVFPGGLLSAPATEADEPASWWILHTRPRAEKALARQFTARRLSFFLPLYQRVWHARGRTQASYNPLFPGYIFLRGNDDERVAALTTNLIANVLTVNDQAGLWQELTRIHHLMESGRELTPEVRLESGALVEIVAGPLAGLTGKVLRRGKKLQFVVEVQLLRQGVSVEIESWMFRPLSTGASATSGAAPGHHGAERLAYRS